MNTFIAFLIAVLVAGGGGFAGGALYKKKQNVKEITEISETTKKLEFELIEANQKLDSLKSVPAKIDTIRKTITKVETKTDTLIMTSTQILQNTEIIKSAVFRIEEKIEEKNAK